MKWALFLSTKICFTFAIHILVSCVLLTKCITVMFKIFCSCFFLSCCFLNDRKRHACPSCYNNFLAFYLTLRQRPEATYVRAFYFWFLCKLGNLRRNEFINFKILLKLKNKHILLNCVLQNEYLFNQYFNSCFDIFRYKNQESSFHQ